jgi:hypothetical protein
LLRSFMACHPSIERVRQLGSSKIANEREVPQSIPVFWFGKPGPGKISGEKG